ncbi:MAG: type II secretion system minor pseudopilin GspI [Gammaproteobacteria bacterium]|nr:type II secretion system minor pseudopilin GspI [Gammaproteobacteria bacterium]MDE2252612.1 type II secretion system minor pseudopilin GspI [Gammaproteobacteria bacterium]
MKARRGFTLVEVLVALAIVALGMAAAFTSLSGAANGVIQMRERTFAAWVGFNQLATERLRTGASVNGKQEHDVEFAGSRWHWEQTVDDLQLPGVKRIIIRVRHADDGKAAAGGKPRKASGAYWLATVVGFRGDALLFPQSELQGWDDGGSAPQQPGGAP